MKNIRRPGVGKKTANHLFVYVSQKAMCVECGKKLNGGNPRHDCFFRLDSSLRLKDKLFCTVCRKQKLKMLYPIIRQGINVMIRAKVCMDCLHGAKLVTVRKYERKIKYVDEQA